MYNKFHVHQYQAQIEIWPSPGIHLPFTWPPDHHLTSSGRERGPWAWQLRILSIQIKRHLRQNQSWSPLNIVQSLKKNISIMAGIVASKVRKARNNKEQDKENQESIKRTWKCIRVCMRHREYLLGHVFENIVVSSKSLKCSNSIREAFKPSLCVWVILVILIFGLFFKGFPNVKRAYMVLSSPCPKTLVSKPKGLGLTLKS